MKFIVALCLVAIATGHPIPEPALEDDGAMESEVLSASEQSLKELLDIKWTDDKKFRAGPFFTSPRVATFEGIERSTFSFFNFLIIPGQCGHENLANWVKNDVSEWAFLYHYGAPVRVHLLSENGDYSTKVFGNPLDNAEADFMVHVPKGFYSSFESLSNDQATFHSYIDIPAFSVSEHQIFSPTEMAAIFPSYSGLFEHLAKPGYQGYWAE